MISLEIRAQGNQRSKESGQDCKKASPVDRGQGETKGEEEKCSRLGPNLNYVSREFPACPEVDTLSPDQCGARPGLDKLSESNVFG